MGSRRPPATAPLPSISKPPTAPVTRSGEHPAVQEMRRKLDSVAEHTGPQIDEMNRLLGEYLESVKTPRPPPPDWDPEADTKKETQKP